MQLKGKKINFLGDSITQGIGASSEKKVYHALLKEKTGMREAKNYGISGTRFTCQANRTNEEEEFLDHNAFCKRFSQMDDDADAVVVFGGTNDYGHGDAPLGGFSDRTPDTFYGACHFLFRGLVEKYLGKPIVIMTPLHRTGETTNPTSDKTGGYRTLKEYVDIIREVAEFYSLPVLDLYKTSGMQPDIDVVKETYIPDGLHPNDNGHAVIAYKLEKFFETL